MGTSGRDVAALEARVASLEAELESLRQQSATAPDAAITVSEIRIGWSPETGVCDFAGLPVAMMWVDTTLAGLMAGVQTMVGTERFVLALQSEGRKSVEADWGVISAAVGFAEGFTAIANIAAVAGWGRWELITESVDPPRCVFRVHDGWEGRYQRTLGVRWGSGMVAGKFAGYCTKRFETNCWAEQTRFIAAGDPWDEFEVSPSPRSLEDEIEGLLAADEATRADMAVALEKLRQEVTERQRAEAALRQAQEGLERRVKERTHELDLALSQLRESEEKFRNIVESSPMGIHIYQLEADDQLRFMGANAAANTILGVDCAQFVGLTLERAFPPLAQTEVPLAYRRVCRDGEPWTTRQLTYEHGTIKGAFDVTVFRTAPSSIAVLFVDTTEREQAQQEKERLVAQLHRARRMEALGLLAGGVAHDLNNILSGIVSFPDLLLEELLPNDPLEEPLQIIAESGKRAAEVVQDLLTVARGSAAQRQVVDLNEIVRGYLGSPELATLCASYPGVAIAPRLAARSLPLRATPVHVRKALMNLVTNAVEACSGVSGSTVAVRTEARYVDRPLQGYDSISIGEYAVLTVEDQGPGIPAADLERVFEPFYSKKVLGRSGTGLGLTVVWNTVHDHSGYIHLESDRQGTRFSLFYPAAPADALGVETTQVVPATRGLGERILVVDDEPRQRQIACRMLAHLGYQASAAQSGKDALTHLEAEPADLLLLDMVMPSGWSGRETYRRILERWPEQRAIIASGFAETDDVRATQEAGAGAFLRKPYTLSQLAEALRAELDRDPR